MKDLRRASRHRIMQNATAIFDGRTMVDCQVEDVSRTGARVTFKNRIILPKFFELQVAGAEKVRSRVMWQKGLVAGVRFDAPFSMPLRDPPPAGLLRSIAGVFRR